jgi:hypothetical protein
MIYIVMVRGSFTIHSYDNLDTANDMANYAYANGKVVTMAVLAQSERFAPSVYSWQRQAIGIDL